MSITPGSMLYFLILFLIFGNLFAFFIGVLMIAAPQRLGYLFKISNRWISTRRMTKPLEKPRQADRAMLRYPRMLGAIMLASAALILIKGIIFISGVSAADGAPQAPSTNHHSTRLEKSAKAVITPPQSCGLALTILSRW